jgi:hypothetical protein
MENTKKKMGSFTTAKLQAKRRSFLAIIALAAVIGFTTASCDNSGGAKDLPATVTDDTSIDTSALNEVINEATIARDGVEKADNASEVPIGRKWVTESEWNAFHAVYLTALETKTNPSSQLDVDTAMTNLRTALVIFNAAKKDGIAVSITLSGTITIKYNGQTVPYVYIQVHTADWKWQESTKIPSTAANSPWSIITTPFSSPTEILFDIKGFDNDKYENALFAVTADVKETVCDTDVDNIAIDMDLNLITISGTLNFDYGKVIPSVRIDIKIKNGGASIGVLDIYNAGNSAAWSTNIPSQTADTDIIFSIVGFDGPIPYEYDRLFALWDKDFGVKVGDQNKSGIELSLISISGTVDVTYNGSLVPNVEISIFKGASGSYVGWLANMELKSPPANTPWSIIIPAYTDDTEIWIYVLCKDGNGEYLFSIKTEARTIKNTNVSGITLINIEGS